MTMGMLSNKLRNMQGNAGRRIGWWCPGCDQLHAVAVDGPHAWQWDGNVEAPTISPSVRCFTTVDDEGKPLPDGGQRTLCHCFVKAGQIEFCGDSPHALAGKTVPLPDLPEWLR
jgi:hypothetical protein